LVKYTHTLTVEAIWYSPLSKVVIEDEVLPAFRNIDRARDIHYYYRVPITKKELKWLEDINFDECYPFKNAIKVLNFCDKRYERVGSKNNETKSTI
jgi:hypothetical protein